MICEECIHYPPSVFGGKPCGVCDPYDEGGYLNCFEEGVVGVSDHKIDSLMIDCANLIHRLRECSKNDYETCMKCGAAQIRFCEDVKNVRMREAANKLEKFMAEIKRLNMEADKFTQDNPMFSGSCWVSTNDMKPPKNSAVLGYCGDYKCIFTMYWDGQDWRHFGGRDDKVFYVVTHWRQLPEDPEKVKKYE